MQTWRLASLEPWESKSNSSHCGGGRWELLCHGGSPTRHSPTARRRHPRSCGRRARRPPRAGRPGGSGTCRRPPCPARTQPEAGCCGVRRRLPSEHAGSRVASAGHAAPSMRQSSSHLPACENSDDAEETGDPCLRGCCPWPDPEQPPTQSPNPVIKASAAPPEGVPNRSKQILVARSSCSERERRDVLDEREICLA